jgi:hypothetical protein
MSDAGNARAEGMTSQDELLLQKEDLPACLQRVENLERFLRVRLTGEAFKGSDPQGPGIREEGATKQRPV